MRVTLADYDEVVERWDPALNGGRMPADFLRGSEEEVHLYCKGCPRLVEGGGECGIVHYQTIACFSLTRKGGAGLICVQCKPVPGGDGDLCFCRSVASNAYLAGEWDDEADPATVGLGTNPKRWWKCPFGNCWQCAPSKRKGPRWQKCRCVHCKADRAALAAQAAQTAVKRTRTIKL